MRVLGWDVGKPGGDYTVIVGAGRKRSDFRGSGYPVLTGFGRGGAWLDEAARERAFRRADRWLRGRVKPARSWSEAPQWMRANMTVGVAR